MVVTAGAGTGKTTLLVDRLLHLLMRSPDPLKITEIVALTFTNKAAEEMKLRLRERLQSYLEARLDRVGDNQAEEKAQGEVRSLLERYHLNKNEIDKRAREALDHIERSEIRTIHSFAATLLRLYPMEAGLDPQFREDDGTGFERYFEEAWSAWLDQELCGHGEREESWKRVLRKIPLEEIRRLAFSLCPETVPLEGLKQSSHSRGIPEPIRVWLGEVEGEAEELIAHHPEEKYQIDRLVRVSLKVIGGFLGGGPAGGVSEEEKAFLEGKEPSSVRAWGEGEFERAKALIRVARCLCQVDRGLIRLLCDLLIPFVERCREGFVAEGFVSFDGLLVRARDLVRDHLAVREELKRQFKAILIDEFQDTDPVQYEILLYLAEQTGRQAREWRDITLSAGKIFVVGDPKQSIYAFRRADIEAYLGVIEKMIKAQNGVECRLTTSFRSNADILDVVNGVFEALIRPRQGVQPSYVAIHPAESHRAARSVSKSAFPIRGVEIRMVQPQQERADADLARRLEGESLARWLHEEVLDRAEILGRDGQPVPVKAKDVAILLRKLTDVDQYLEPLRKRGIRYVVEGERYFYAVQEVIDAVNLLRTVEDPCDRTALVGFLRSPVGGIKDSEILQLQRQELLDYREVGAVNGGPGGALASRVRDLYGVLRRLHEETRQMPVGEAVSRIFAGLPIKDLAARSFHGEQAVANLEKIREQAEVMGREGSGTLKEVIATLERRVTESREESESVLAEEGVDAVRVLSVHKAKGLEFPVVVLAGCQAATSSPGGASVEAYADWSTGLVGLRVGRLWSLPGVFLEEKRKLREEEEQKRVFYVAATRAREYLAVSCASGGRRGRGSFLSMLEEVLGDLRSAKQSRDVPAGSGAVRLNVVQGSLEPPGQLRKDSRGDACEFDWKAYKGIWEKRGRVYREVLDRPLFVTPTALGKREAGFAEGTAERGVGARARSEALLIGELAHRFLQGWDFSMNPQDFRGALARFLARDGRAAAGRDPDSIRTDLETIFETFFASPAYEELRTSHLREREVPLLMPWDGQIMEGVIDVIYEREGNLYVADYKTDRVEREELSRVAESYRQQAVIYYEAVKRALRREVSGFKLIFLRLGEAVQVL